MAGFTETIFTDVPTYVAGQLNALLGVPFSHYRPNDLEQALAELPAGWVDWGPGFNPDLAGRDSTETLELSLTIVIITGDKDEEAIEAHRQRMAQIIRWCRTKKGGLTAKEVGTGIRRLAVAGLDWLELEEIEGVNLRGRVIQAGGILVQLQLYD